MRLKDLTKSAKKGINAESTCKYLEANGVPFKKIFRDDDTGADFILKTNGDAERCYNELSTHKKINKNFNIEWDGSNIIKVYFK